MAGLHNLALASEYITLFTDAADTEPKSTNNRITPPDQENMVRPLPESKDETNVMAEHRPPKPVTAKKRKRDQIANKKRKNRMKDAFLSSDEDSEGKIYDSDGQDRFSEEDKVINGTEEEEDDSEDEVVEETPLMKTVQRKKGYHDGPRKQLLHTFTMSRNKNDGGKSVDRRNSVDSSVLRTLEARYEKALKEERAKVQQACAESAALRANLEVAKSTLRKKNPIRRKADQKTPFIKRIEKETRAWFTYKGGRMIKFINGKHKIWSTNENTLCCMLINSLHWPHDRNTVEFKKITWNNVLAPMLRNMLTAHKNKIHQEMRKTFNSLYFLLDNVYFQH